MMDNYAVACIYSRYSLDKKKKLNGLGNLNMIKFMPGPLLHKLVLNIHLTDSIFIGAIFARGFLTGFLSRFIKIGFIIAENSIYYNSSAQIFLINIFENNILIIGIGYALLQLTSCDIMWIGAILCSVCQVDQGGNCSETIIKLTPSGPF